MRARSTLAHTAPLWELETGAPLGGTNYWKLSFVRANSVSCPRFGQESLDWISALPSASSSGHQVQVYAEFMNETMYAKQPASNSRFLYGRLHT